MPAWSPDSTRIFYGSDRAGAVPDFLGPRRRRRPRASGVCRTRYLHASSHAGRGQAARDDTRGGRPDSRCRVITLGQDTWRGRCSTGRAGRLLRKCLGMAAASPISPPNRDSPRSTSGCTPASIGAELISRGGGIHPLWGPAGSGCKELFYWTLKGTLKIVSVTSTPDLRIGTTHDVPLGEGYRVP